jgi:antitoxin component of MazEF toxin-antitoxin module
MVKIQENTTTRALLIQIPKAIVTAKKLKKGMEINFIINNKGEIVLEVK